MDQREHGSLCREDQLTLPHLSKPAFEQALTTMRNNIGLPLSDVGKQALYQFILDYETARCKDVPVYRIQPYEDASKGHRWRMIAENGRIVADGSEAYASKANNIRAACSLTRAEFIVMPYVEEPK